MPENSTPFTKILFDHFKEKYVQISGAAFILLLFRLFAEKKFEEIFIIENSSTGTYIMFLIAFLGLGFIVLSIDTFFRYMFYPWLNLYVLEKQRFKRFIKNFNEAELTLTRDIITGKTKQLKYAKSKIHEEIPNFWTRRSNYLIGFNNTGFDNHEITFYLDRSDGFGSWPVFNYPYCLDLIEQNLEKLLKNKIK